MAHFRQILHALFFLIACCPAAVGAQDIDLNRVADGVYAAVRLEPPGLTFVSNTVFIVEPDHVIVVDSGVGTETAEASIKSLKSVSDKPVRYLINTHWHDDHHLGNAAWRAAYPGALVIQHANWAMEASTTGATNRKLLLEQGPAFAKQIREALTRGENLAGKPISTEERLSYASDLVWAERYFRDTPGTPLVPADLEVGDKLVLKGKRRIEVLYLGRAHTAADLVVWLPEERIAVTGDLVVWPIPLFGSTSFPLDFATTLEKLIDLKPALIVPGHGPLMRDDVFLRRELALLKAIGEGARAAAAKGESLEAARKSIDLDAFRREFAGESALRDLLFRQYVVGPGIARAHAQASGALK